MGILYIFNLTISTSLKSSGITFLLPGHTIDKIFILIKKGVLPFLPDNRTETAADYSYERTN